MRNNKLGQIKAFTMLEMMIVVVIIGLFASMAAPSFTSWIPKMKLKTDAREKVNYLRMARSQAISENQQYGIYFDTDNNQIIFFKDTANPTAATYDAGMDSLVHDPICCESNINFSGCSFSNSTVVFYSNGSASTSGSIVMTDSSSCDNYTINILASTGRIRLQ